MLLRVSAIRTFRYALWGVMAAAGLVLAARALFRSLVPVHSPMNAEGWFALALVLALLARAGKDSAPRPPLSFSRLDAAVLAGLALLTAAAFWRALGFYFLSDDFILLKHARLSIAGLGPLFITAGGDGFFRPIGYCSLALTQRIFGDGALAWHAAALALHFANSVMVYLLALRTVDSRRAAAFAAALFAIHGARPEAVVWIAGRFDLLASFFTLLGLLMFLRGGVSRWLALLTMVLAMLSKESAYVFPVLLLALPRTRPRSTIPFFATAAALFAYRVWLFGGMGGYRHDALALVPALKALTLRLWAVLCFPVNWSVDPGWPHALLLAAGAAALAALAATHTPRRRLFFPVALALLPALPAVLQLLIGPDLQKSRLVYLPSVGFCLLVAAAADGLNGRLRWAVPAFILAANLAHLEHNLSVWQYAASRARPACAVAAQCVREGETRLTVEGLPDSLHGVYFFQNGFAECVERERGAPVDVDFRVRPPMARWDSAANALYCCGPKPIRRESDWNLR